MPEDQYEKGMRVCKHIVLDLLDKLEGDAGEKAEERQQSWDWGYLRGIQAAIREVEKNV